MAGIQLDLPLGPAQIKPSRARALLVATYPDINLDYVSIVDILSDECLPLGLVSEILMKSDFTCTKWRPSVGGIKA